MTDKHTTDRLDQWRPESAGLSMQADATEAGKLVRLVFMAHAEGNQPIRRVVDRINTVERLVQQTIVMRERKGAWTSTIKDVDADEALPA
jgi:hypothetical protein